MCFFETKKYEKLTNNTNSKPSSIPIKSHGYEEKRREKIQEKKFSWIFFFKKLCGVIVWKGVNERVKMDRLIKGEGEGVNFCLSKKWKKSKHAKSHDMYYYLVGQ